MIMEKVPHPQHAIRCIITGPSECGKSFYLTSFFPNTINEHEKIYFYSPSLLQKLYQKLNK